MSVLDRFDKTSLRVGFGDIDLIVRDGHFAIRQKCQESGHCSVVVIEKEQWQSFLKMVSLADEIQVKARKAQ
ncbi:hypothetical protein [Pseudomonas delhiensis]|uniref:hypothetical protein n=1 Tax=Pseudomonas delhiensis TaxID=366289 RepID=UPI0031599F85